MSQWWHKTWSERTPKERIIGSVVAIIILIVFCCGVYLCWSSPYKFKHINSDIMMIAIFCGFLLELSKIIFYYWLKKEHIYDFTMTVAAAIMFLFFFSYIVGVLHLKTLSDDFQTTRATVLAYYPKSPSYQLLFSNGREVGEKYALFAVPAPKNEEIQKGDCLTVQYRENWLVIEIQMKQNHGKRDKKACFVY